MTDDAGEEMSVGFVRLLNNGQKLRTATDEAKELFGQIARRHGVETARAAFQAVLDDPEFKRGDGRPGGLNRGRDEIWLAIYDWRKRENPGEKFADIVRRIADDPSAVTKAGKRLTVGSIKRDLREIVDARNLSETRQLGRRHETTDWDQ